MHVTAREGDRFFICKLSSAKDNDY